MNPQNYACFDGVGNTCLTQYCALAQMEKGVPGPIWLNGGKNPCPYEISNRLDSAALEYNKIQQMAKGITY